MNQSKPKQTQQQQQKQNLPLPLKSAPVAVKQAKPSLAPSAKPFSSQGKSEVVLSNKEKVIEVVKTKKRSVSKKYGKGVGNWLKKFNPWLMAISDPFNIRGVRIPDMVTTPSGTFTIWDHRQIASNANGCCAVAYGISHPGEYPSPPRGSLIPVAWFDGLGNNDVGMVGDSATCGSGNLFGITDDIPSSIRLPKWSDNGVQGLFDNVRLVSFGVRIVFTGNYINAQGTITIVSANRNWLRNTAPLTTGGVSVELLQTHPDVQILSVPKDFGGCCIYKPLDNESLEYLSSARFLTDPEDIPDSAKGGEIYIAITGAVPDQAFQVDAVWNFEGTPRTNQLDLVDSAVSRYDMVSMESTWNALPEMPSSAPIGVKGTGPEAKIPVAAITSEKMMSEDHPAQERTMLEKIVDGIGGALDTGLKIAEKVTPFLAAVL